MVIDNNAPQQAEAYDPLIAELQEVMKFNTDVASVEETKSFLEIL